jgi:hypothetical protein
MYLSFTDMPVWQTAHDLAKEVVTVLIKKYNELIFEINKIIRSLS